MKTIRYNELNLVSGGIPGAVFLSNAAAAGAFTPAVALVGLAIVLPDVGMPIIKGISDVVTYPVKFTYGYGQSAYYGIKDWAFATKPVDSQLSHELM